MRRKRDEGWRWLGWAMLITASALTAPGDEPRDASSAPHRGQLIERVECTADAAQSYVLYVPSRYDAARRWPVIFCFDASARGRLPVELLVPAAEQYGYLVAGSLTSRNGPWAANAAAAEAMMNDVRARFAIDPGRTYTAGVSGGARVATAVALAGAARGVIACAAGFPPAVEVPARLPFVLFGTVGTEDFNFQEIMRLRDELRTRDARSRIVVFAGPHQWAPAEVMTDAVEWLELQAMRSGARSRDAAFIETQWSERWRRVPAPAGAARSRELRSLADDFSGLREVAAVRAEADHLAASDTVRADLQREEQLARGEQRTIDELGAVARESRRRKQALVDQVIRRIAAANQPAEREMLRRAVASYHSMARETSRQLGAEHQYELAAGFLELSTMLDPARASTWYELARVDAYAGNTAGAVAALSGAVDHGLADPGRLEADDAFRGLRSRREFQDVVARMRADVADLVRLPEMRVSAVLASVEVRAFYLPNAGGEVAGLSFLRVESVRPNSAAAAAGVEPGLEVTAIQDRRLRGLSDHDLEELLKQSVRGALVLMVRTPGMPERELRIALHRSKAGPEPVPPRRGGLGLMRGGCLRPSRRGCYGHCTL